MRLSPRFDPLIHAPNRLQLCALLAPVKDVEFAVLRDTLQVSDSVLSKHIKQLVEAGHVKVRKSNFDGRRRTWARLTRSGRKAFDAHVSELQRLASMSRYQEDKR